MLRKRIPRQDDGIIYGLVEKLLLPFARQTVPDLRIGRTDIIKRLKSCDTYVDTAAGRLPVGFIALRVDRDKRLSVDMLAVNPKFQGRGIGTHLMRQAERTAGERGCREVVLWVDDANTQAQTFYVRKGYDTVHYDARLRCYMMMKRLG
ncbi:GNAT family N-acetyltransferase [Paenibacillus tyrfis]|uniref:GCN5 family acetyltransferase n=1 Tax=Paenibacillus tyrfis TaxID=1501230 RepID=A0A081NXF0_9BACL|nr:GNAT family N-acetyltransferase [Paenibacillus tyrfis]KEQ23123.1 GCN5 family acetyltransferase [Paenibacillus tyrfis]